MDKNNEIKVLKIFFWFSLLFLGVTIFLFSDFYKIVKQADKQVANKTNQSPDISQVICDEKIVETSENRLVLPIPLGVSSEMIKINMDVMNRCLVVSFPKGVEEYDISQVINNTSQISDMSFSATNNYITIKILLNDLVDEISCVNQDKLYFEFFKPHDLYDAIVVVDAGHGGDDVGAIQNGIYEKDIDLRITLKLKEMFDQEQDKVKVYYTRLDDSYPGVEERVDFVNELKPDLFVSIHSNWYENSNINGTSVLYNTKDKSQNNSFWFSKILLHEILSVCDLNNKDCIGGNDIYIVRHSSVPVALVETGFISNLKDFNFLISQDGQQNMAKGIYNGITKALTELGKY